MEHIIHSFLDSAKLLPFLFFIYLIIEYLEHKNNSLMLRLFSGARRFGPLLGAVLGTIPQCGFSVIAADLYAGRRITLGTLIAIFIATSDEAIPLMMAHPDKFSELVSVIGIKFLVALLTGFLIDIFAYKETNIKQSGEHHHFHGNCESCEGGIFRSAVIHSLKIFIYIFIVNVVLGLLAEKAAPAMQYISSKGMLQVITSALFGIIPNCAASVVLTELYLAGKIVFSALVAGLCTGAGVGLLVLFRQNKNIKENLAILVLLYAVGVFVGIILNVM